MAEVKFNKGSEEWQMFTDFWKICQKYWEPEESDRYWDDLITETNSFFETYKTIELAREIVLAFINTQEKKLKAKK